MWKENSASPLHILHAGFGIGSFIIPLIANPFLAAEAVVDDRNVTNTTACDHDCVTTPGTTTTTEKRFDADTSRIEYAYGIACAIAVGVSLIFYAYHFLGAKARRKLRDVPEDEKDENSATKALSLRKMFNPATCAGGRLFYAL